MSADRKSSKPLGKTFQGAQDLLNELLDFGPVSQPVPSADLTQRLLVLVQKINEINQRIDKLSNHY